jgi:triphosphoribosyl-dephospho-CoA synthase
LPAQFRSGYAVLEDETHIRLSPGAAATLAFLWEATAPKPGNVHPSASFEDTTFGDYVASSVVVGPIIELTATVGVGRTVLDAVRATRRAVGTNTNLGALLLMAPLAAVPHDTPLQQGIGGVLERLTTRDTADVYAAIRLARPGGLQHVSVADVYDRSPPELSLVNAMRLAADRDLVARQFVNDFADVFEGTAQWITEGTAQGWPLGAAIVHAHVRQMAAEPDGLIARKCGPEVAHEASQRAAAVLRSGTPGTDQYKKSVAELDAWLRADGHRRNPGTSADLVTAGLFVLLCDGMLRWPVQL